MTGRKWHVQASIATRCDPVARAVSHAVFRKLVNSYGVALLAVSLDDHCAKPASLHAKVITSGHHKLQQPRASVTCECKLDDEVTG